MKKNTAGRTAIVMSGGGAKGAFELGAADYLIRDKGEDPEVFVGVSTGNLNAAMLAQGRGRDGLREQLDALKGLWFDIEENDDLYHARFGGVLGLLFKADSVYSNKPLWKLIRQHVDPEKLKNSGRLLRIGVVGLRKARYSDIRKDHPRIREMIRASAAIPVLFNPVGVDDERYVDGGVMNVTPLRAAFDALAELRSKEGDNSDVRDTIYVILASPTQLPEITDEADLNSGIEIGLRALEIAVNEIYRNDLSLAVAINETVKFYQRVSEQLGDNLPDGFPFADHRYANLVLVRPDIFHMGSLEFNPAKIRQAFDDGRARMKQAIADAEAHGGTNITPEILKRLIA